MWHRRFLLLAAFALAVSIAHANPPNGTPEQAAQTAAQTDASTDAAKPTPVSTSAAQPAAKKVWTNDDVTGLRSDSPISTVGSTDPKPNAKPSPTTKTKNGRPYQAQIARLESQIPVLDSQIAELQAAIDGKPTGDAKSSQRPRGVKADDWNVEMQQLEKKRDNILDQIAVLKDEARHQGV